MKMLVKARGKRSKRGKADKFETVMGEFKRGTLRSGSGAKVTHRKQALAIAASEAGISYKKALTPVEVEVLLKHMSVHELEQQLAKADSVAEAPGNKIGIEEGMVGMVVAVPSVVASAMAAAANGAPPGVPTVPSPTKSKSITAWTVSSAIRAVVDMRLALTPAEVALRMETLKSLLVENMPEGEEKALVVRKLDGLKAMGQMNSREIEADCGLIRSLVESAFPESMNKSKRWNRRMVRRLRKAWLRKGFGGAIAETPLMVKKNITAYAVDDAMRAIVSLRLALTPAELAAKVDTLKATLAPKMPDGDEKLLALKKLEELKAVNTMEEKDIDPLRNLIRSLVEALFPRPDPMQKAKYLKRTGSPGHYVYAYKDQSKVSFDSQKQAAVDRHEKAKAALVEAQKNYPQGHPARSRAARHLVDADLALKKFKGGGEGESSFTSQDIAEKMGVPSASVAAAKIGTVVETNKGKYKKVGGNHWEKQ